MVASYMQGQKFYPVPYAWKKLLSYLVIVTLVYLVQWGITALTPGWTILHILTGLVLLGGFTLFVLRIEKKEFQRLPYIGKYLYRSPNPARVP
jgi:hypothetical protein